MKNLFKFLLLGAFTFSLGVGFVGCKNYDKDIEAICDRLETIEDLLGIPGNNKLVSDVTTAPEGITIHYTDGTTAIVAVNGTNPSIQDAYVVKNENGSWTLYAQEKGKTDYVEIPLAGAASAIAKIDVWGWASSFNPAAALSQSATAANNSNNLPVNWAGIRHFRGGDVATNGADGTQTAINGSITGVNNKILKPDAWAGVPAIAPGVVLTTLEAAKTGIIVEVFPSTADIDASKFTLVDSKGNVLPVAFSAAVPVTGHVTTRATSKSGVWFLQMTGDGKPYKFSDSPLDYFKEYSDKFDVAGTRAYSLYLDGVKVSEYTPFSIEQATVTTAVEEPVGSIAGADKSSVASGALSGSVTGYKIKQGVAYSPVFVSADATALTNNDAVVDYYWEIGDVTGFDTAEFKIEVSADKSTFTVTRMPDAITAATFTMNVYKLGIGGGVYVETVTFQPLRNQVPFVVDLGNYTVEAASPAVNYVGKNLKTIDLTGMFAFLKTQSYDQGTLDQVWKRADIGARTYRFSKIVVDGEAKTDTELATWVKANGANGGALKAFTKTNGTTEIADYTTAAGKMYTANSIVLTPAYAFTDTGATASTPANTGDWDADSDSRVTAASGFPYANDANTAIDRAFEIGKKYEVTIDFIDEDGDYINSLTYTFTPVLPSNALYVKDDLFWKNDVLNAWYHRPAAKSDAAVAEAAVTIYDDGGTLDTGTSYANGVSYDFAPGAAYVGDPTLNSPLADGGFKSFTDGMAWAIASPTKIFAPNTSSPDLTSKYVTFVQTGGETPSNDMVLTLFGQYIASYDETAAGAVDINEDGDKTDTVTNVPLDLVQLLNADWEDDANVADVDGNDLDMTIYNAYGQEITMAPDPDFLYLDAYKMDLSANSFKVKVMSAMKEGTIVPAEGTSIKLVPSPAGIATIDNTDIIAHMYNATGDAYHVFTTSKDKGTTWAYDFTYIDIVEFVRPETSKAHYAFVTDAGAEVTAGASKTKEIVGEDNGLSGADKAIATESHINIYGSLTVSGGTTSIDVRVTDRFGKVKQVNLPITIEAATR